MCTKYFLNGWDELMVGWMEKERRKSEGGRMKVEGKHSGWKVCELACLEVAGPQRETKEEGERRVLRAEHKLSPSQ